ncbi:Lysophospholipase, alpha-beta hydrolase superfamily [Paenibacillus algorifonticola]|uniref:Lysophospholipase, alpha-beta hydrolase superfamily n=1 Tax=Paenibacillus algorifonticola TaxID=684063 RepID=A0A1I2HEV4_9BACL|nr:alpha/beta hydrolase [Paenibacillus algorifonticola]SFF28714.1 Lysophospholipase, alpha-beta hydrolase superfamily [Paenibacillus algorifonticola]
MNKHRNYNNNSSYWESYQRFFPAEIQLKENNLPIEEWWQWNSCEIHLDRLPAAESPLKIVLVHGAGGNGRLFAPYGKMLQMQGYEMLAPDLPPYGLSKLGPSSKPIRYEEWIQLLVDLIESEYKRDGKPIVLLGASIGGMLAYHVAARSPHVQGLIATTFVDTSDAAMRLQLAPNKYVAVYGKWLMDAFPILLDSFRLPVSKVSRMDLIANNAELAQLIMEDPRAAATRIPLKLLRTFLNMTPEVQPENFTSCPVLLVHPEVDPMTPYAFSESFYKRLACPKKLVLLEGAGHFPIEQPGLEQLSAAVLQFLANLASTISK